MVCERCGTIFCDDGDYAPDADSPRKRFCSYACKHKSAPAWNRRKRQLAACAAQDKEPYRSAAKAESAARSLRMQYGRVLYPYHCPCGSWHLTSAARGTGGAHRDAEQ